MSVSFLFSSGSLTTEGKKGHGRPILYWHFLFKTKAKEYQATESHYSSSNLENGDLEILVVSGCEEQRTHK